MPETGITAATIGVHWGAILRFPCSRFSLLEAR
jgi:hypothetical protein